MCSFKTRKIKWRSTFCWRFPFVTTKYRGTFDNWWTDWYDKKHNLIVDIVNKKHKKTYQERNIKMVWDIKVVRDRKGVRQFFRRWSVWELAPSSHMPQLFTVFVLRLSIAGGQKCDFCRLHFRREYRVVHSFWVVKVWQSGARCRH